MRAFSVAGRAILALYNELFFLIGISLLWWVTGGFFMLLAAIWGGAFFTTGGPWWIAPLAAIPSGPAMAALAVVTRRAARDIHVDRSYYLDGLKTYWRPALALSAIGMVGLALMSLNILFYLFQQNALLQGLTLLWVYVLILWVSVQLYVYPILVSLERPTIWLALRTALAAAFANPFFSLLLLIIAGALTALSVVVPILLIFIWPALMLLLGAQSLRLFLARAGVKEES